MQWLMMLYLYLWGTFYTSHMEAWLSNIVLQNTMICPHTCHGALIAILALCKKKTALEIQEVVAISKTEAKYSLFKLPYSVPTATALSYLQILLDNVQIGYNSMRKGKSLYLAVWRCSSLCGEEAGCVFEKVWWAQRIHCVLRFLLAFNLTAYVSCLTPSPTCLLTQHLHLHAAVSL